MRPHPLERHWLDFYLFCLAKPPVDRLMLLLYLCNLHFAGRDSKVKLLACTSSSSSFRISRTVSQFGQTVLYFNCIRLTMSIGTTSNVLRCCLKVDFIWWTLIHCLELASRSWMTGVKHNVRPAEQCPDINTYSDDPSKMHVVLISSWMI